MTPEADKGAVLLTAVQQGDQDAFGRLYDQYSAAIHGVVLRIVGSGEQAEEVLQDTFVKIWRSARSYDPSKGRAFTWMVNIARNTAIDLVRTKQYQNNEAIRTLDKHVYRLGSDEERARVVHTHQVEEGSDLLDVTQLESAQDHHLGDLVQHDHGKGQGQPQQQARRRGAACHQATARVSPAPNRLLVQRLHSSG